MDERIDLIDEILYNLSDDLCKIENKELMDGIFTIDFLLNVDSSQYEKIEGLGIELADAMSKIRGIVNAEIEEIKFSIQISLPQN